MRAREASPVGTPHRILDSRTGGRRHSVCPPRRSVRSSSPQWLSHTIQRTVLRRRPSLNPSTGGLTMAGAIIVIDQPTGAGSGTPGVARQDLWQAQQINLSVGIGGNSTFQWDLLDIPPGS